MDILIKGIEKPKNCKDCTRMGISHCPMKGESIIIDDCEKPLNCPLIELPPHGNLVDMDILKETIASIARKELPADESWIQMLYALDNAPTILEASE